METFSSWMESINTWIDAGAETVWVLPVVFALATIDGFFPPLPSESVVVALAAISASTGSPNLLALGVVAALGAFCGDQIAYHLGRHTRLARIAESRHPRVRRTVAWARHELDKRGAMIILVARYIPVGRVAVNMMAGVTRYPRGRFIVYDGIAAVTWAGYSIAIGTIAGASLKDNPLLAAGIGIVAGVAIGWLLDHLIGRLTGRNRFDSDAALAQTTDEGDPDVIAAGEAARADGAAEPVTSPDDAASPEGGAPTRAD